MCAGAARHRDDGVRLAHTGRVGLELARPLAGSPAVARILHPALPSCPGHAIWQRDFAGACGVFSVVLKPEAEPRLADALSLLRLFAIGASWGGTRSLVAPMSVKAERTVTPWTDSDTILRISVGLEDPADLRADLDAVFQALSA